MLPVVLVAVLALAGLGAGEGESGWYFSTMGKSCAAACAGKDPCHLPSMLALTTSERLTAALAQARPHGAFLCATTTTKRFTHPPSWNPNTNACVLPPSPGTSTCTASASDYIRLCCCSTTGCSSDALETAKDNTATAAQVRESSEIQGYLLIAGMGGMHAVSY